MKKKQLIEAAAARIPAELVIKNARVIDVFCRDIIDADVAVSGGMIIGLGSYDGESELDARGQYLMPSFIDSHVHIESSMLSPAEYAKIIAPKGVTAVIADPHEIVNVCGEAGIRYMMESAENVPVDILYMLPSCVPATPFDHAGVSINAEQTRDLMQKYSFLGLGEMMNYPGVVQADEETLGKIACAEIVDGHAPMLSGKKLNAYLVSGVMTDHECSTPEEMHEKISKGMYVQIREGTQSQNLEALIRGITPYMMRRILFCTDDRYVGDIIREGSITNCVRKAVQYGVNPIDAITIASLNAAQCYGLHGRGAIAPGYRADFMLCKDITAQEITHVFKDGKCIAHDGKAMFSAQPADCTQVTSTVRCAPLCADDLCIPFYAGMPVIGVLPKSLYTLKKTADTKEGLNLCAVIERHKGTGNIGKCYIDGFGLKGGAIAQTIGHDSHNITVLGDNAEDMAAAVNALGKEGGMCVVKDGTVTGLFPLPIAGLMSNMDAQDTVQAHKHIMEAVSELEMNQEIEPFMMLSFLSLLVIPEWKLGDKGIFDVNAWKYIS